MGRASVKSANERRQCVWLLMLKGHNPQFITKALKVCDATIYKDIKYLTEKSRDYVFDMAKGTHILMYQRAIEGISLTLSEAWKKFNDKKVPEKQKPAYLRLTRECQESMIELISNGPCVMALQDITNRAERLGLETSDNYEPLALSEEEQIRNYINKNYVRSSSDTADTDTNKRCNIFKFTCRRFVKMVETAPAQQDNKFKPEQNHIYCKIWSVPD